MGTRGYVSRRARPCSRGLNLARHCSLLIPILQCNQPAAVQCDIYINRIRIEGLPKNQHCFLMRIAGGVGEVNVGGQFNVTRNLLPRKLKRVLHSPHVLATAGEHVSFLGRIVSRGARMQHRPDI